MEDQKAHLINEEIKCLSLETIDPPPHDGNYTLHTVDK